MVKERPEKGSQMQVSNNDGILSFVIVIELSKKPNQQENK